MVLSLIYLFCLFRSLHILYNVLNYTNYNFSDIFLNTILCCYASPITKIKKNELKQNQKKANYWAKGRVETFVQYQVNSACFFSIPNFDLLLRNDATNRRFSYLTKMALIKNLVFFFSFPSNHRVNIN